MSRVTSVALAFILSGFLGLSPTTANAECTKFVSAPMTYTRENWSELELFQAKASLNPQIDVVQTVATGQGSLNIDQYSLKIGKNGQEASELLSELRTNIEDIVFKDSHYSGVSPIDTVNKTLWESPDYTGAILVFTLSEIPGLIELETGAVVVSCHSPTDFLVSTVKVGLGITYSNPGWHPVSGNRAFGVRDNGDDSLTIFVKAADRVVNAGIFATSAVKNEWVFQNGHEVWVQMLENLKKRYADRNPRGAGIFSERVDY